VRVIKFSLPPAKLSNKLKATIILKILTTVIVTMAVLSCEGCDESGMTEKDQSNSITILTSTGNFTTTVQGRFSDNDWNGVPQKIADAFTNVAAADIQTQTAIFNAFSGNDVTIIVEKGVSYSTWRVVTGNKKILYLNINGLSSLQPKVKEAVDALRTATSNQVGKGTTAAYGIRYQVPS
jgi:hypothetical protein